MAQPKRQDHKVHKYKRVEWGKNKTIVFRCMLPGCSHYVHEEFVRGRMSLCWKCGNPFVMNPDKERRVKPKCDACQHGRDPIMSRLDGILDGL